MPQQFGSLQFNINCALLSHATGTNPYYRSIFLRHEFKLNSNGTVERRYL